MVSADSSLIASSSTRTLSVIDNFLSDGRLWQMSFIPRSPTFPVPQMVNSVSEGNFISRTVSSYKAKKIPMNSPMSKVFPYPAVPSRSYCSCVILTRQVTPELVTSHRSNRSFSIFVSGHSSSHSLSPYVTLLKEIFVRAGYANFGFRR